MPDNLIEEEIELELLNQQLVAIKSKDIWKASSLAAELRWRTG